MVENIRIVIEGDPSKLDPTIDKLKAVGRVDAENAAQFQKNNNEFVVATEKRNALLQQEIKNLEALQRAKAKAYTPENIAGFNKSIDESKKKISLLAGETVNAGKSMDAVVSKTNALGESVKKSYGFLRLAANIIPGLGISGLILAGYEALSTLLGGIVTSTDKLKTAQTDFNATAIQDTTEYIEVLRKLENEIDVLLIKQNILTGKQTKDDLQKAQSFNAYVDEVKKENIRFYESDRVLKEKATKAEEDKLHINLEQHYENNKAIEKNEEQHNQVLKKLQLKLGEEILLINKEKEVERRKLVRDVSVQDLENQKKEIEAQFKVETSYYKQNIDDKQELTKQLFYIEEQKNEQLLIINEELATRKKNQDIKVAKATITDQEALYNRLYNINLAYDDKISALRSDFYNNQRVLDAQYYDAILKDAQVASDENVKEVQSDLKKRKEAIKEAEVNLADTLKLANETAYTEQKITQEEHDKQDIKDQLTVLELKKTQLERYSNEYIEIEIKEQELKRQLREKEKKEIKKDVKEQIDNLQQIGDFAIKLNEDRIKDNIEYIDHQEELQKDNIETQRRLAEQGKENTLAFEEKQQADLEKKRLSEQKKLQKLKELEFFLNSIASYSKDDPKSAVAKALAQLAIAKGVEASFAEKGGIIGKIDATTQLGLNGWSNRHKNGNDVLTLMEKGEGVLSKHEISHMGGEKAFMNFKNMLNTGFPEIPSNSVSAYNLNMKPLEKEVRELKEIMRNKKELDIDFDKLGNMIVTTTHNGVKDTVSYMLKKPGLNG